jgi:hypothetical protein
MFRGRTRGPFLEGKGHLSGLVSLYSNWRTVVRKINIE